MLAESPFIFDYRQLVKDFGNLIIKTLKGIRNKRDFNLFYKKCHLIRNKESSALQFHPESPYHYYKPIYFEAFYCLGD